MVSKRRGKFSEPSTRKGEAMPAGISRQKKTASKKGQLKKSSARTRTSLVGMKIYLPDVKPSLVGRKLLKALESLEARKR